MTASQQITKASAAKPPPKTYGRIILTLYNCLLPESAFKETPSQSDGLDIETETDLRILGCELIQTAGILLRLPQVAMATAQVYLQRFYYSKSFVRYPMETMAMGSILLASKVEEKPTHIRDILNVFHHIKQVRAQKPITPLLPDHSSHNYQELRNQVVKAERRILKELGFCVHVKHPHKLIVVYLQLLTYEKNKQLMQISWNYMNDALRTDVFMRFPPETIACACIYLTARKIGLPLPNNPHWFSLFSVKEEDMRNVCIKILRLYKRPKLNSDELERKVDCLKKVYQANKILQAKKNKEVTSKGIATKDKSDSPAVSSSRDEKRNNDKGLTKSTTPPLKHHSNRIKSKHERRSRSPYDRKDRYKSRHRSRSPIASPRRDRSRDERRNDDKRRDRGYISNSSNSSQTRKYDDYERSKTRDSRR